MNRRNWELSLTQPKVEVRANYGFSSVDDYQNTGLILTALNKGIVPVRFANWGQIILPDKKIMEPPQTLSPSAVAIDFDPSVPLEPGDSVTVHWVLPYLKEQLVNNGYAEVVSIQGRFTDKLGNDHLSSPVPLLSPSTSNDGRKM